MYGVWTAISVALLAGSALQVVEGSFHYAAGIALAGFYLLNVQSDRPFRFSANLLVPIGFALLATVALLENYVTAAYTMQDGISVSNPLAYWMLGDDGWSLERFRQAVHASLAVTGGLLALGAAVFWLEWAFGKRR